MGRYSTGANTVDSINRIEMKDLIKWGYFKKYANHYSTLSWSSGSRISMEVINQPEECSIRLIYTITDNHSGKKTDINYKVWIKKVPSNLGKGFVLYFICPFTYKKSRTLYRAYGSHYFKSKEAYQRRIYYDSQMASKLYVSSERYRTAEAKLEKLYLSKRRKQTTFKGKPTKYILKLEALERKVERLDYISLLAMNKWLGKKGILKNYNFETNKSIY